MFRDLAPALPPASNLRRHDTGRVAVVAVTLAEVGAVPSALAAGRAGDALVEAGACEVWLFGSVARGEFTGDNDIDRVIVCGDLDHARGWDREQGLARLGEQAARWPVDVMATDLPERKRLHSGDLPYQGLE